MDLITLILAVAAAAANPPTTQTLSEPASVADFELICFCTSRVGTPHPIVTMDNNGVILKIARTPVSKADVIAQGVPVLDSQIRVLRDWDLLQKTPDGKFVTKMGVLGPVQMAELRSRLAPHAKALVQSSSGAMDAILAELRKRHQAASAHAVMYSYILDNLLWENLGDAGRLRSLEPTIERPMWNGIFWAVFPKPVSSPGTNSTSVGNADLRMMWKPGVLPLWGPLSNNSTVKDWLKAVGEATPGNAQITPPTGSLSTAVVVDERTNDPIYVNGRMIAQATADALRTVKLDDLMPYQTPDERLVIAGHEFIWLALAEAAKRPGFAEPAVLRDGTNDQTALGPLLIVDVRGGSSSAH